MFTHALKLFEIGGIEIKVDLGWALVALFIAWSLAQGVFPQLYEGLDTADYIWMAAAAVLGLAVSIIAHELAHSFVAKAYGTPVSSITLFMFGGVAAMEDEPRSPKSEFFIAIAGPIMSIALCAGFVLSSNLFAGEEPQSAAYGVLRYLGLLNGVLAVFNLLPAFPMDGGRALRAALWARSGDAMNATRQASSIGKSFGTVFIGLGIVAALAGAFAPGIWYVLIGLFLRGAAEASYTGVRVRSLLGAARVRQHMTLNPHTVQADTSLDRFVTEHVYRRHHDFFPIEQDGGVVGVATLRDVKGVQRDAWGETAIVDVMQPVGESNTIAVDTSALAALQKMRETRQSRLLVLEQGRLVGVVVLKDLLDLIALDAQLEQT